MARSRRSGRRRPRLDWVQNEDSYSNNFTSMNPGAANAVHAPLVFSQQSWAAGGVGYPVTSVNRGPAWPQTHTRTVVRAVRGSIELRPIESWTADGTRGWGFRIAKFLFDPNLSTIILPVDYNMYGPSLSPDEDAGPYIWADDRFSWEHRGVWSFNSTQTSPYWKINVNWRGRVVLEEDEAFAMYIEGDESFGSSASMNVRTWLRTLVEVPD